MPAVTKAGVARKTYRSTGVSPVDEVYNLIRGANPQPGAWTTFNGAEVKIFDSRKADGQRCAWQRARDRRFSGIEVATADGAIRITKVRADAGKVTAAEYAAAAGLEAGSSAGKLSTWNLSQPIIEQTAKPVEGR